VSYTAGMKSLTIRLPDELFARIEDEARMRKISKSDIVRERLSQDAPSKPSEQWKDLLSRVVGAVDGLPHGDSRNVKAALKASGYGRKHSR
jgi:predicted DNA-binding protein